MQEELESARPLLAEAAKETLATMEQIKVQDIYLKMQLFPPK